MSQKRKRRSMLRTQWWKPIYPKSVTTAAMQMMDAHYWPTGIYMGWDKEQFYGLCRMLEVTPEELAKFVALSYEELHRYLNNAHGRGWFPPSVSLHFSIIQTVFIREVLKLDPPNEMRMPTEHLWSSTTKSSSGSTPATNG